MRSSTKTSGLLEVFWVEIMDSVNYEFEVLSDVMQCGDRPRLDGVKGCMSCPFFLPCVKRHLEREIFGYFAELAALDQHSVEIWS